MKTALQEVFSKLEELHPSLFDIHTEKGRTFVHTFHVYLEMEKYQHQITWDNALRPWEDFEHYHNETFKSE